jgi:D-ribulokinase
MNEALVIGIDVGTSGVRAAAMVKSGAVTAGSAMPMADFGADMRAPATWRRALEASLDRLFADIPAACVRALAVDGTSGTMVPVDPEGAPLANALMYSDAVSDPGILAAIARCAPAASAARGAASGLAKAMVFATLPNLARVIHQADWIAGTLSGRFDLSDENNALKTGYDPVARHWPGWIEAAGLNTALLPRVLPPGSAAGHVSAAAAARFGLSLGTMVVAGTTDGCASFLATGASKPGEAVTALGSSLTLKLLSDRPVFAPQFGIYSHRIGDAWLAGGASNSGGKALARHFSVDEIIELTKRIDPATKTGLAYYPLDKDGERFPFADPAMKPVLSPRPADDAEFLKGMFEGIAAIEALGYQRLAELGCPKLISVRSAGGGATNPVWTQIRQRRLNVPFLPALSLEAAAGTARLALQGAIEAGLL